MTVNTISFHTLGCKLNQLETESIAQNFAAEGFSVVPWGSAADIYVLNTCTVTSMAEQKARREIRKVLRDRPHACVLATGCYAQLDPEALRTTADLADRSRVIVVSGDLKSALLDLPAVVADASCASAELPELLRSWARDRGGGAGAQAGAVDPFRFDANDFSFHSRAFLKIQDGCDNVCAFCRVRLARGRGVSLSAGEILRRLLELESRGYAEAVLTGVNVSRYKDADGVDFPSLIEFLLRGSSRIALRISSTEPDGVNERFAAAVADPRVRPHFHLSVQSGSDAILRSMRRRYASAQVDRAAALLRSAKGDPFLACDIIAGFPGETEADFGATVDLCRRIGFAWIHAFPFSPRPGTEAAGLPGRVPEREAVRRVDDLMELSRSGRTQFAERQIGSTVSAVVETSRSGAESITALSENYLRLSAAAAPGFPVPPSGSALRCRIVAALPDSDFADAEAEVLEILPRMPSHS